MKKSELFSEIAIGLLILLTFFGTMWLMVETGKKAMGAK